MIETLKRAVFSYHDKAIHRPRVERVAASMSELIGRASSILDIGCGDGTVARTIAERVGATRVAGVDVLVRPDVAIDVRVYDGRTIPYDDDAFEVVLIADVLHHAEDAGRVLREALRVASRAVIVKDHFRGGPVSDRILLWMDVVGNAAPGVLVRGRYLSPNEWVDLVRDAGGRVTRLDWPLRIHDLPFRLVTRSELHFAARIEPISSTEAP